MSLRSPSACPRTLSPQSKKQTLLLNFDKNDLRQLVSCVERALHKSPSDPAVHVKSLSYLPAERKGNSGGGDEGSALDGTPFCPKSRQTKKSSIHGKSSNKFVLLTVENFDPGLFLAMEDVRLAAVVVQEVCTICIRVCFCKNVMSDRHRCYR